MAAKYDDKTEAQVKPLKMIRLRGGRAIDAYNALKRAHYNMSDLIRALIEEAATERVGWKPKEEIHDN